MTPSELQALARQGHASAIATLFDQELKSQGITTRAKVKEEVLHLLFEAQTVPSQGSIIAVTQSLVTSWDLPDITAVKAYGRQQGQSSPAWTQALPIIPPQATPKPPPPPKQKRKSNQFRTILYLYGTTLILIILVFFDVPYALPTTLIAGCICIVFLLTSEDYRQEQLEFKRHQKELAERRQWQIQALARAKELQLAEEDKAFQNILHPQNSPLKQLQTKLAHQALKEIETLQCQLEGEIETLDYHSALVPVRSAVQQFNVSSDYEVSDFLNKLIEKTLLYQELCLECHKLKQNAQDNYTQPSAISTRSELGQLIRREFPELQRIGLSELAEQKFSNILVADLSARYYDFDHVMDSCKSKSSDYTRKLQLCLNAKWKTE